MILGKLLRRSVAACVLVSALGASSLAYAEADNFGTGNGHSGALVVSGTQTVNTYAGLTQDAAAGGTVLTISATLAVPTGVSGPTAGFAAGDLVMVWRSTGVAASEDPSGNRTKKVDLATALSTTSTATNIAGLTGTYEFARVASVAAGTITLTAPLVNAFTRFVSQVVKVPEYTTVTVPAGATLKSTAWQEVNGMPAAPNPNAPWAGGITIFLATGAVANAGTIHSNARGFHGAIPPQRFLNTIGLLNCDNDSLDGNSTNGNYGQKGEGVIQSLYLAASGGKGNLSNAGGGGQCVEGGGGGGANGGNGGSGSDSVLGLGVGGYPGIAVAFDIPTHLTMGGGGGAGRQIASGLSSVSFGGFGGGVVFVRAASMSGAGKLQANGGTGEDSGLVGLPVGVASEGSGGGGAGGTIVVRLTGTLDCDSIASPGGNGGDAVVIGIPVFGSGGGGGGGRVSYVASQKSDSCKILVTPGNKGGGGSDPGHPGVSDPTTQDECDSNFGAGLATSCKLSSSPICDGGKCKPCNGNFASGSSDQCPTSNFPTCDLVTGICGKQCAPDAGAEICSSCAIDPDCTGSQVCDTTSNSCVPGCRVGTKNTSTDGGVSQGACKEPSVCVAADGGSVGQCEGLGAARAASDLGIIEGGGCSTTPSSTASPLAVLGAVSSALLAWRRKKRTQATKFPPKAQG